MNPLPLLTLLVLTTSVNAKNIAMSPLPKPANPGLVTQAVTQENIKTTICVPYYTKTVRPSSSYTNKLKLEQLAQYEYFNMDPSQYEEDHIVPLALGGDPVSKLNLWPQPRHIDWSAAKKDHLEVFLKRQVCKGTISLKVAQAVFLHDWTVGYKKYKLVTKSSTVKSTEDKDDD